MAKRQYDFNAKSLGLFAVLVLVTTAGVSLIYGGLYGFSYMGQRLSGAAQVMTAAATQPVAQGMHQMGAGQGMVQGQGAGQYFCPQHGAAGATTFNASGVPLCPLDGQPMHFNQANAVQVR